MLTHEKMTILCQLSEKMMCFKKEERLCLLILNFPVTKGINGEKVTISAILGCKFRGMGELSSVPRSSFSAADQNRASG